MKMNGFQDKTKGLERPSTIGPVWRSESPLVSQQRVVSKCKHTKESLSLIRVQLRQLVGFGPQFVSFVELKHCTQVNGIVPAPSVSVAVLLLGCGLARWPHRAHQRRLAAQGVRVPPDAVAERPEAIPCLLFLLHIAAEDSEGGLAVDEVEASLRDDDLVVLQPEATLSKRLTLTAPPLQHVFGRLVILIVATWRQ